MTIGYIAYIDEAGDAGLKSVRPLDPNGASEWLILGAVVIRAENSLKPVQWVREIKSGIRGAQRPDLHFYTLSHAQKLITSQKIGEWPLRCFAVISNKKNMSGYHNPRAAQVRSNNPFYNWLLRLLLERVTRFCADRTMKDYGEVRKLKIEMGETGGFSLAQTQAYLTKLSMQSTSERLYLARGDLAWEVIDVYEISILPAAKRAGIQLADTVASSFRAAVELKPDGSTAPEYALNLLPRLAMDKTGRIADFGVKIMPSPLWKAGIIEPQIQFFEKLGYNRRYLASPDPRLASRF
jgi:Protein of unknown function (DUF3800)